MKKIKNIVVATDFSVTARNAYSYANEMAKKLGAGLTIVHVKDKPIIVSDVVVSPMFFEDDPEIVKEIEKMMVEENKESHALSAQTKIKIFTGDPVKILTELSKHNDTDLIVIGTTGLSDVLTSIFGSVSLNLSNKAYCPVIIIPRDAKWQPIEKILYASNPESLTSVFAQDIMDFAVNLNSAIHFVNIDSKDERKEKDVDWNELFVATDSSLSYEKHTIYAEDVLEELKKYSEEKKINLMAFASKHRTFWQNLAHNSITEDIAITSTIPIMVIHIDDKRG